MTADHPTSSDGSAVCPVDHQTREVWLAQARAQAAAAAAAAAATVAESQPTTTASSPSSPSSQPSVSPAAPSASRWGLPSLWSSSAPTSFATAAPPPQPLPPRTAPTSQQLGTERVVSSIPRAPSDPADAGSASLPVYPPASSSSSVSSSPSPSSTACPVNHEVETGADAASGNWIYPSEKMFFDAMKRKGNDGARPADMRVVVPIHNAVNERAWKDILEWEKPYTGGEGQCGGPRLYSFAGLSQQMSPRARLNTLLGYTAPFDRHDWIVDRCGTRVEYVIDFYAGRPNRNAAASPEAASKINFYLDVRPKLNSWEGVKMRTLRSLGLS